MNTAWRPGKIGQVLLQRVHIQVPAVAGEFCVIEIGPPIATKVATVNEDQFGTAGIGITKVFELVERTIGVGRCTDAESTGWPLDNELSINRSVGLGRPAGLTFRTDQQPPVTLMPRRLARQFRCGCRIGSTRLCSRYGEKTALRQVFA